MGRRLSAFRAFAARAGSEGLVLVRVVTAAGSTPREAGAFMAVARDATFGTIGGGRLELEAIKAARDALSGAEIPSLALPLGPEIGQCCGGHVTLDFRRLGPGEAGPVEAMLARQDEADPDIWIFGGGHVGRALSGFLALLPVRAHLVESREDELAIAPEGVERHLSAMPESLVDAIAPGGAAVVLTHDHALDFLVVSAALARDDLAFVGMIGSKTKRAVFSRQYIEEGGDPARLEKLVSPIGVKIPDKRPEVIAATVASAIMVTLAGRIPGA